MLPGPSCIRRRVADARRSRWIPRLRRLRRIDHRQSAAGRPADTGRCGPGQCAGGIGRARAWKDDDTRAIAQHLRSKDGVLQWRDGSDLDANTFAEEIHPILRGLPQAILHDSGNPESLPEITVIIDGLDESPMVQRLPSGSLALSPTATPRRYDSLSAAGQQTYRESPRGAGSLVQGISTRRSGATPAGRSGRASGERGYRRGASHRACGTGGCGIPGSEPAHTSAPRSDLRRDRQPGSRSAMAVRQRGQTAARRAQSGARPAVHSRSAHGNRRADRSSAAP